ncbi:MAG: alpha/beta hydrolase [Nitrosarchaeum sp.]|nr:alpha/beta hydrolase [Nitrosarchaeum sp.]
MLLIDSTYNSPAWIPGKHTQTILPAFRKVKGVHYNRERISTFDQDFLDLDWSSIGSSRLVILSHGVEGNTYQGYMMGMTKTLNRAGWDALAWNFRSCSGEMNNKVRFYHAGSSEDLDWVIKHALKQRKYKEIALIGFSLGGCHTLKLLGEQRNSLPSEISKALVFSTPCDLKACVQELSFGVNRMIYLKRFLISLKNKLSIKKKQFPDLLSHLNVQQIQCFEDFDNNFTAPLWGYKNAHDYYEHCSCKQNISDIRIPTLIINAQNDPFLHPDCNPIKECRNNAWVNLELPVEGGHLGFMLTTINGHYWSEDRALEFLKTG